MKLQLSSPELKEASWLVEKIGPFKYCSTQLDLPASLSVWVQNFAYSVPDGLLAEDGRETDPHVTMLYGLESCDGVSEAVRTCSPAEIVVEGFGVFESEEHDVLHLKVSKNKHLQCLRDAIERLPNNSKYPFNPHITIAYMKPGTAKAWLEHTKVQPPHLVCTVSTLTVSDRDGTKTSLPLSQDVTEASMQDRKRLADLEEAFHSHAKNTDGEVFTVFKNPSKSEWHEIFNHPKAKAGDKKYARGLKVGEDTYAWAGDAALHTSVYDHLKAKRDIPSNPAVSHKVWEKGSTGQPVQTSSLHTIRVRTAKLDKLAESSNNKELSMGLVQEILEAYEGEDEVGNFSKAEGRQLNKSLGRQRTPKDRYPRASEHSWRNRPLNYKGSREHWDGLVYELGTEGAYKAGKIKNSHLKRPSMFARKLVVESRSGEQYDETPKERKALQNAARNNHGVGFEDFRKKLKTHGMVLSRTAYGEFRVNHKGGKESTAYYTDDLHDAHATGVDMAKRRGTFQEAIETLVEEVMGAGDPGNGSSQGTSPGADWSMSMGDTTGGSPTQKALLVKGTLGKALNTLSQKSAQLGVDAVVNPGSWSTAVNQQNVNQLGTQLGSKLAELNSKIPGESPWPMPEDGLVGPAKEKMGMDDEDDEDDDEGSEWDQDDDTDDDEDWNDDDDTDESEDSTLDDDDRENEKEKA